MTQSSASIWGQRGDAQLLLGMFDLQSIKNEPCGSSAADGTMLGVRSRLVLGGRASPSAARPQAGSHTDTPESI